MSINSKAKRDAKKKKNKKKILIIKKDKSKIKNPKNIEFICPLCKTREFIPRDVVEYLDDIDDCGDISIPPRFDCKKCFGKMEPIHYIGVSGHIYEYNEH